MRAYYQNHRQHYRLVSLKKHNHYQAPWNAVPAEKRGREWKRECWMYREIKSEMDIGTRSIYKLIEKRMKWELTQCVHGVCMCSRQLNGLIANTTRQ